MLFSKEHRFKSIPSTNNHAYDMALHGASEGEYVVAEEQTKGRGRLDRSWYSAPGNLYLSMILRPKIKAEHAPHLTFVSAVAVANTLKKYLKNKVQIKWPNDILVNRKKICGVLTQLETEDETNVDFVIIGVGLNVNENKFPLGFPLEPTSLFLETKKKQDVSVILREFLKEYEMIYKKYLAVGFEEILKLWQALSVLRKQTLTIRDWDTKVEGQYLGIDEKGGLILKTSEGDTRVIYSGDLVCF